MEKIFFKTLRLTVLFARNTFGCFNTPYVTFRRLSQKNLSFQQTIFIFLLAFAYFAFASLIKVGMRNPFLLTMKFNILVFSAMVGFISMVILLYFLAKLVGGQGKILQVYTLWAFTLLPTIIWFFTTSALYLFFPPPRTMSILGKLYSISFIIFSASIFFWKSILYYLTLRFSMRLDLLRIVFVSLVVLPVLASYSVVVYKLGIFKIPFV